MRATRNTKVSVLLTREHHRWKQRHNGRGVQSVATNPPSEEIRTPILVPKLLGKKCPSQALWKSPQTCTIYVILKSKCPSKQLWNPSTSTPDMRNIHNRNTFPSTSYNFPQAPQTCATYLNLYSKGPSKYLSNLVQSPQTLRNIRKIRINCL